MKVLHVITGLDAGGAEIQLAMLLERTRHEASVVTLYNPGPIAERIRAAGTPVHDIGMRKNTQVSALYDLWQFIRAGRFDVVHAHLYRSQVYARPAARLAGTPLVLTTEHSIGETHIERREMTRAVRALYLASERFSDATIAVSDVVRERLVAWGVPASKIVTIPNGLDVSALAFDPAARRRVRASFGIPEDAFVVGTLGRLDPNKRVDLLVEAAAPLLGPKTKVLVVGRGEDHDRLVARTAACGASEHVVFAGFQSDTAAMLAALDVYVAASVQETFGLSVLEALASGLPVLYTVCPALDGVATARARQVAGDVLELRSAIASLRDDQPARTVPIEVFDRYGMASVVRRTDDLYVDLLGARARAGSRRARQALEAHPPVPSAPATTAAPRAEAS